MDASESIALLKRGAEGVRTWNDLRSRGEAVPAFGCVDLAGSQLAGVDLSGADLRAANLAGACLSRANLSGAQLQKANLEAADLSGANLNRATMDDAVVRDAKLDGASFHGVKLSATQGLTQAQVNAADGDADTELADGYRAPGRWAYAAQNPYSVF